MSFEPVSKVNYTLYSSTYSIKRKLPLIFKNPVLSFDVETRSVYDKELRQEARAYLKEGNPVDALHKQAKLVENSSGLSHPSIIRTTHFIFGQSKDTSHVVVCDNDELEMELWRMVAEYKGVFLVHNTLFDLKILYQRLGKLPANFVDTALIVKCYINHVDIWKAKTGLKELMGEYYSPKWTLMDEYEPENLKDPKFIMYAAIDGAATFYLWEIIQEEVGYELPYQIDPSAM